MALTTALMEALMMLLTMALMVINGLRAVGPVSSVITAIYILKGIKIRVPSGWLMLYTS